MKYTTIKNTELKVSQVCLGTAGFGSLVTEEVSCEILSRFVEGGGSFIDTANVYGRWHPGGVNLSERVIGRFLRETKAYDKVVVATKAAHYDPKTPHIMRLAEDEIRRDLEESRESLGIATIDLLWLHRDDLARPIEQIVDTMEKLVEEGAIRYYGASNYTPERLTAASEYAKANGLRGFCAVSNQWNPAIENTVLLGQKSDPTLVSAEGQLERYEPLGLEFIPYNATAKGFFAKFASGDIYSEKYQRLREKYLNQPNIDLCDRLIGEAEAAGVSVQTQLLRMMITSEFPMIPITTVSSMEQVEDILAV